MVTAKFILNTTGGSILVNPSLRRGLNNYTIHVETATKNTVPSGCLCTVLVNVEFNLTDTKYKKLFVVSDKRVNYEFDLSDL